MPFSVKIARYVKTLGVCVYDGVRLSAAVRQYVLMRVCEGSMTAQPLSVLSIPRPSQPNVKGPQTGR